MKPKIIVKRLDDVKRFSNVDKCWSNNSLKNTICVKKGQLS